MNDKLTFERAGDVAVITMDDGKANACGFAMLEAINDALGRALAECTSVALLGRPGVLSGGFDLKVINGGDRVELQRMINLGARTIMRLYGHPQPLVCAATGHAVALGAFILLASDHRIGAAGEFKIGLNETAIGLTLPTFGIELVRARLSPRFLTQAAINAQLYPPDAAVDVGFLDETVAPEKLRDTAIERAKALGRLDSGAFAANKRGLRAEAIKRVLASID